MLKMVHYWTSQCLQGSQIMVCNGEMMWHQLFVGGIARERERDKAAAIRTNFGLRLAGKLKVRFQWEVVLCGRSATNGEKWSLSEWVSF